jgi:hypothetical protein
MVLDHSGYLAFRKLTLRLPYELQDGGGDEPER